MEDCLAAIASGGSKQLRRRTSISLLSNDQVRSRVVRELVNTERDFVKVLRDVKEVIFHQRVLCYKSEIKSNSFSLRFPSVHQRSSGCGDYLANFFLIISCYKIDFIKPLFTLIDFIKQ